VDTRHCPKLGRKRKLGGVRRAERGSTAGPNQTILEGGVDDLFGLANKVQHYALMIEENDNLRRLLREALNHIASDFDYVQQSNADPDAIKAQSDLLDRLEAAVGVGRGRR
jgi:ferredoxin-fold anticodon binding domain-containing protein